MNTEKIEMMSINALVRFILQSDILVPYIDSNDKTPSWDGNLFLYNSYDIKKENLKCKIPVQVKGVIVNALNAKKYTYSIQITDLRNYLNDGGVLFFVITMKNIDKYNIFYINLLPFDINKILNNIKKDQETKSLTLEKLDIQSPHILESICENFRINKKLQFSTFEHSISVNDSTEYFSKFVVPDNVNVDKFLLSNDLYLYAQNDNMTIPVAIDKIKLSILSKTLNKKVCVGNKIYYDNYLVITKLDDNYIQIGKCIKFYLYPNGTESSINFKNIGTLNEQLKDVKFLIDLYYAGDLNLGGISVIRNINKTKEFIENLENYYKHLLEIRSILNYFNVKKDLKIEILKKKEFNLLNLIIDVVLYNKNVEMESCDIGYLNLNFANINILVFASLTKENYFRIIDLFKSEGDQIVLFTDNKEDSSKLNRFLSLKAEYMIKYDNLDLQFVEGSIMSFDRNEKTFEYVNIFVLELIKGYDLDKNLIKFLFTALKLLNWIYESSNASYIYINICQALKRIGNLSNEHIEKLIALKDQEERNDIKFAINILIDSKNEANFYFNKLSLEEQNNLKNYPIYTLYINMN